MLSHIGHNKLYQENQPKRFGFLIDDIQSPIPFKRTLKQSYI